VGGPRVLLTMSLGVAMECCSLYSVTGSVWHFSVVRAPVCMADAPSRSPQWRTMCNTLSRTERLSGQEQGCPVRPVVEKLPRT
jgi:hypothetical protein